MRPLYVPFGFATRVLKGINYAYPTSEGGGASGNPQPQPVTVYTCPKNMRALIRGEMFGPAGALGYLAFALNELASWPADQHGMFPDALVVPCGARFEFAVNSEQVVSGVASVGSAQSWAPPDGIVYASFNWELFPYDDEDDQTNGGYGPDLRRGGR